MRLAPRIRDRIAERPKVVHVIVAGDIGVRLGAYAGPVAKPAVQFACTECGTSSGRWFGKCPGCNAFGTLVEEIVGKVVRGKAPPKPLLRLVA